MPFFVLKPRAAGFYFVFTQDFCTTLVPGYYKLLVLMK